MKHETDLSARSRFSHLQRKGKTERPGRLCFATYKEGGRQSVLEDFALPPTKKGEDRASWKTLFLPPIKKGEGRSSWKTALPPIKKGEDRASWKTLLCHL